MANDGIKHSTKKVSNARQKKVDEDKEYDDKLVAENEEQARVSGREQVYGEQFDSTLEAYVPAEKIVASRSDYNNMSRAERREYDSQDVKERNRKQHWEDTTAHNRQSHILSSESSYKAQQGRRQDAFAKDNAEKKKEELKRRKTVATDNLADLRKRSPTDELAQKQLAMYGRFASHTGNNPTDTQGEIMRLLLSKNEGERARAIQSQEWASMVSGKAGTSETGRQVNEAKTGAIAIASIDYEISKYDGTKAQAEQDLKDEKIRGYGFDESGRIIASRAKEPKASEGELKQADGVVEEPQEKQSTGIQQLQTMGIFNTKILSKELADEFASKTDQEFSKEGTIKISDKAGQRSQMLASGLDKEWRANRNSKEPLARKNSNIILSVMSKGGIDKNTSPEEFQYYAKNLADQIQMLNDGEANMAIVNENIYSTDRQIEAHETMAKAFNSSYKSMMENPDSFLEGLDHSFGTVDSMTAVATYGFGGESGLFSDLNNASFSARWKSLDDAPSQGAQKFMLYAHAVLDHMAGDISNFDTEKQAHSFAMIKGLRDKLNNGDMEGEPMFSHILNEGFKNFMGQTGLGMKLDEEAIQQRKSEANGVYSSEINGSKYTFTFAHNGLTEQEVGNQHDKAKRTQKFMEANPDVVEILKESGLIREGNVIATSSFDIDTISDVNDGMNVEAGIPKKTQVALANPNGAENQIAMTNYNSAIDGLKEYSLDGFNHEKGIVREGYTKITKEEYLEKAFTQDGRNEQGEAVFDVIMKDTVLRKMALTLDPRAMQSVYSVGIQRYETQSASQGAVLTTKAIKGNPETGEKGLIANLGLSKYTTAGNLEESIIERYSDLSHIQGKTSSETLEGIKNGISQLDNLIRNSEDDSKLFVSSLGKEDGIALSRAQLVSTRKLLKAKKKEAIEHDRVVEAREWGFATQSGVYGDGTEEMRRNYLRTGTKTGRKARPSNKPYSMIKKERDEGREHDIKKFGELAVDKSDTSYGLPDSSTPDYMIRPNGTVKEDGFLGVQKMHVKYDPEKHPNVNEDDLVDGYIDGDVTEFSIASYDIVDESGEMVDYPTLVPTLTTEERDLLINEIIPERKPVPETIEKKANAHARKRIAEGKSVFWRKGDDASTLED